MASSFSQTAIANYEIMMGIQDRGLIYEKLAHIERQVFGRYRFITKVMSELQQFSYINNDVFFLYPRKPEIIKQNKHEFVENEYYGIGAYNARYFGFINFSKGWCAAHPEVIDGTYTWLSWSLQKRNKELPVNLRTTALVLTLLLLDTNYNLKYLWSKVYYTGKELEIPINLLTEKSFKDLLVKLHQ